MKITDQMKKIRSQGGYIPRSVHYSRRAHDGVFEVVAQLYDSVRDELEIRSSGEVVIDTQRHQGNALTSVRFFRGQEEAK